MILNKYPLAVLEDIESILFAYKTKIDHAKDILRIKYLTNTLIIAIESINNNEHKFKVTNVVFSESDEIISYDYEMCPTSSFNKNKAVWKYRSRNILISDLEHWIDLMYRYNNLNNFDPLIHQYEINFYNYIKLYDEDAETKAFNLEQQSLLIDYFEVIENLTLESSCEYESIILDEIKVGKNLVVQAPKNKVMRQLSRIYAYAIKEKRKLAKDFISTLRKEIMKKALYGSWEKITELLSLLS